MPFLIEILSSHILEINYQMIDLNLNLHRRHLLVPKMKKKLFLNVTTFILIDYLTERLLETR